MNQIHHSDNLVFLAEDSSDDEALTIRALKALDSGVKVEVSRDGHRASEYLHSISQALPKLILLDIKLPKLSGLELLKMIRESSTTRMTPVVMLTSSDEPRDLLACYEAGASGFVRKPVDYDEYVAAVKALGNFWLKFNLCAPSVD